MREEVRLLLDLSRNDLDQGSADRLRADLAAPASKVSWSWFLDQAVMHRVVCLIARNLDRYDLCPAGGEPGVRFPYRRLMKSIYAANAQRNEELIREFGVITSTFADAGVYTVVRKGPVLLHDLYRDVGVRQMKDLDFMVHPDDKARARELLTTLGYAEGVRANSGRELAPVPRDVQLYQRLHMPNIVMHRLSGSRFVDWFTADISLNQFLPGSGWSIPSTKLRERSRQTLLYGFPVNVLKPEQMLMDLATHTYKEATTLLYVNAGKDLCLYKFLDIAEASRGGNVDWDEFLRLVRELKVVIPVFYSLYFTAKLYPDAVPEQVLTELRPDDVSYLNRVGSSEGAEYEWEVDFLVRLFDLEQRSRVPRSKARM